MKKKVKQKIPQNTTKPIREMSQAGVIASMRRLTDNPDFRVLKGLWLTRRWELLEKGKKEKKPEQWSVLEGFDEAIFEPERLASMESVAEQHEKQAEELLQQGE